MKKTYQIEVDCIHCASKMEQAASKTPGVLSASVNFMGQKMIVEFAPDASVDTVMAQIVKNCRKATRDGEIFL